MFFGELGVIIRTWWFVADFIYCTTMSLCLSTAPVCGVVINVINQFYQNQKYLSLMLNCCQHHTCFIYLMIKTHTHTHTHTHLSIDIVLPLSYEVCSDLNNVIRIVHFVSSLIKFLLIEHWQPCVESYLYWSSISKSHLSIHFYVTKR